MEQIDNLKQVHEQERGRLAVELCSCNEHRERLLKRMKEIELILATIEHLQPKAKPESTTEQPVA